VPFDRLARQVFLTPEAEAYDHRCVELSRASQQGLGACWMSHTARTRRSESISICPAPYPPRTRPYCCSFTAVASLTDARNGAVSCAGIEPGVGYPGGRGYRLSAGKHTDDPFADSARALSWVHQHIAEYGGNPNRLFVGGHSAGGAIAALLALRKHWLTEAGVPSQALRGALCLSTSFNRLAITGSPGSGYELPHGPLPIDPDARWPWLHPRACHFSLRGAGANGSARVSSARAWR